MLQYHEQQVIGCTVKMVISIVTYRGGDDNLIVAEDTPNAYSWSKYSIFFE